MKTNQKGFSVIEVLLIVVVVGLLGGAGWYVWSKNKTTKTSDTTNSTKAESQNDQAKDPYEGWATCNDSTQNLTFKYPANWSTEGTSKGNTCGINIPSGAVDETHVALSSPVSSEKLFKIQYFQNGTTGVYSAESGQIVRKVIKLPASGGKQLYVVFYANSYASSTADKVTSMALTDVSYSEGEKVEKVVGVHSTTQSGKYIQFSANLSATSDVHQLGLATIAQYESHPEYNNVLNMFKSFTLK